MRDRAATPEAFNQALIAFITALVRSRTSAGAMLTEIDESTPLFATGLIDSMGIVELLAFVEQTTGGPIPIHKVDMQFFGTIGRISRSFFRNPEEQEHGPAISTVSAGESRA